MVNLSNCKGRRKNDHSGGKLVVTKNNSQMTSLIVELRCNIDLTTLMCTVASPNTLPVMWLQTSVFTPETRDRQTD